MITKKVGSSIPTPHIHPVYMSMVNVGRCETRTLQPSSSSKSTISLSLLKFRILNYSFVSFLCIIKYSWSRVIFSPSWSSTCFVALWSRS